jgi:hypothetical protein
MRKQAFANFVARCSGRATSTSLVRAAFEIRLPA